MQSLLTLESTLISHGLPYPRNLETARALERVAREHQVEPCTIAILAGEIKIGLSNDELQHFAQARDVLKLSRRDIAMCIARKQTGATTVSATMWLARRAGMRVFATGGIGGVHRSIGAAQTWDVSVGSMKLALSPIAVVCTSAKAILGLPAIYARVFDLGIQINERADIELSMA